MRRLISDVKAHKVPLIMLLRLRRDTVSDRAGRERNLGMLQFEKAKQGRRESEKGFSLCHELNRQKGRRR